MEAEQIAISRSVKKSASELLKVVDDAFGGIENAAAVVAAHMLESEDGEQDLNKLSSYLGIDPQQVGLLLSHPGFNDALDRAITFQVYAPMSRIKAVKLFESVVSKGKKIVASGGKEVEVDRDVSELIAADTHLRKLQGREIISHQTPAVNIVFEGLSKEDIGQMVAGEIEDAEFTIRKDNNEAEEGFGSDERRKKARASVLNRFSQADGSALPPETPLSRFADFEEQPGAEAGDFFIEDEEYPGEQGEEYRADVSQSQNPLSPEEARNKERAANYKPLVQRDAEAIMSGGKALPLKADERSSLTHAEWLANQKERARKRKEYLKGGREE